MRVLPAVLLGVCLLVAPVAGARAAIREETIEPIAVQDALRVSATTLIRDPLAGDLEGLVYVESRRSAPGRRPERGGRSIALRRPGWAVAMLDVADFGGGRMVVIGWVSGGHARYLMPEIHRPVRSEDGWKLEKVWGPYEKEPLYQGQLRLDEQGKVPRLVLEDHLIDHSFAPPLLAKTIEIVWRDGAFVSLPPTYEEPQTAEQRANLAHQWMEQGDYAKSLVLYLEAIRDGERTVMREDPELASALLYSTATDYEKLGEPKKQREYLERLVDSYPDTGLARKAADKLLQKKSSEPRE